MPKYTLLVVLILIIFLVVPQIACGTSSRSVSRDPYVLDGENAVLKVIYLGADSGDLITVGSADSSYGGVVVVHPTEGQQDFELGQLLEINYSGAMTRSLPPQISAESIEVIGKISEPLLLDFESAEQLLSLLGEVNYLDVRTPEEFAGGHVPSAINLPLAELSEKLSQIDHELPTFVYCRSGARSSKAADYLSSKNYIVFDLGGIGKYPGELSR